MTSYTWDLYEWTIKNEADWPSEEFELISAASGEGASGELVLPSFTRSSLDRVTWHFNVTATNWLGGTGWDTFEVNIVRCAVTVPNTVDT